MGSCCGMWTTRVMPLVTMSSLGWFFSFHFLLTIRQMAFSSHASIVITQFSMEPESKELRPSMKSLVRSQSKPPIPSISSSRHGVTATIGFTPASPPILFLEIKVTIQFCQILTKKKEKEEAILLSWKNKMANLPARSLTMLSTLVAVSVAVNTIYVENWIDIE